MSKLTLRGILTPEGASYLSALPPATPLGTQPHVLQRGLHYHGVSLDSIVPHGRPINGNEDGLQAQLEALEAGLPPLLSSQANSSGNEASDFQSEEALQMYFDSMAGAGASLMRELRQQPYPVDAISSILKRERVAPL